jgi:hypothetical protein
MKEKTMTLTSSKKFAKNPDCTLQKLTKQNKADHGFINYRDLLLLKLLCLFS